MVRYVLFLALILLPGSAVARDYCDGNFCYQKKARVSCLRPEVWSVLHKVAARIGRLEITSACDGKHARHSFHYVGKAVDFRPMQASSRAAVAVLRNLPEVGGIGTYTTGFVHADVGERKAAWHHYRKPRVRVARVAPVRVGRASRTRLAAARTSVGTTASLAR
jgi:hypothetical protein